MEGVFANISSLVGQNIWMAYGMALLAGVISSFSPCVLTSVPLLIGYVGGYAGDNQRKAFLYSTVFCTGLILSFTALGAFSAYIGYYAAAAGRWWYVVLGILMMGMGLQLLGIIEVVPGVKMLQNPKRGFLGAFFLGVLGGGLSSPCATPVLVVILTLVAGEGNLLFGTTLLAFYAIGHCTLLLLAGTSLSFVEKLAGSPATRLWGAWLKNMMAGMILLFGLYLVYTGI